MMRAIDQEVDRRRRRRSSTCRSRQFGSLDWRRSPELIAEGYKAAEAMRDQLLPLAVSEAEYEQWQQSRQSRRRTDAAGAGVRHRRRLQPRRPAAPRRAAGEARRRALQRRDHPARSRRALRARPLRDHHLAHRPERRGRSRPADPGADEAVRAAVPDARRESREHDVERLPHHHDRALPRVRRARLRLGAARRRHARLGPARVGRALPAGAIEPAVRGAVCRDRQVVHRLHPGRCRGRPLRADLQPARPQPGFQSRARQRHPPRRLHRPRRRQRAGRRPGPSRSRGQGDGQRTGVALRRPGQPRGALARHLLERAPELRVRQPRYLRRVRRPIGPAWA